ncbi:family 43 glycosylhydrolase [Reichenbachiella sp.]|uniref:family 43 glycosylhydrolase n=1 Tax=Reichenbachiella sp. TaxID=2184521 RepID=UPI003297B59C
MKFILKICWAATCLGMTEVGFAQNPFISGQYTADPTARVFNDSLYVYPSHDVPCKEGQGFIGFCMPDYHVFSTTDLTNWTDHGVILGQEEVDWVDSTSYSMWAPDCIEKNGKYYFYFPARDTTNEYHIGVAISETPYGPFVPQKKPIEGVVGIDPGLFVDKDGQAYLYWQNGEFEESLTVAKLSDDMLKIVTKPQVIPTVKGFVEGPFVFERKGNYYLTYPNVINKTERIVYAMGKSPMGPFEYKGVIMDESPTKCWTNHHSIVKYNGQWYFFYHHNDYSPHFDKNRSIRADSLFFNADGTIEKITPSWRGVGITNAKSKIQVDRYSDIAEKGAAVHYLDTTDYFKGWKVKFDTPKAWVRYNQVSFANEKVKKVTVWVKSKSTGELEIRRGKMDGTVLANVNINKGEDWQEVSAKLKEKPAGNEDIFIIMKNAGEIELDWICFK